MNAVLNIDQTKLEDLALELGASVHRTDGSVFNTAGRSGVARLPPKLKAVEPDAPVAVANPAPTNVLEGLTQAITDMAARLQAPAPVVNMPEMQPAQVVIQAPQKTSWRFEFERNPDKTIKAIIANPL